MELLVDVRREGPCCREPMVVQHPRGSLFVTDMGGMPTRPMKAPFLWRSNDGGATWTRVDVGTPPEGAVGSSDVDVAVAHDGTLHLIGLAYDNANFNGRPVRGGSFDQRKIKEREDLLVYTSEPFKDGIEVTGPITPTLSVSSSDVKTPTLR